jgi:threonine synthase
MFGMSFLTHLECPECERDFPADVVQNLCPCGAPLFARYNLERAAAELTKEELAERPPSLWRYHELLPVIGPENIVSLGEGFTPLIRAKRLGRDLGLSHLYIKDESQNITGSFKARGLAVAVSKAYELGVREIVIPSAGNAGGALAAYAARVGVTAHIFMPQNTPQANIRECQMAGADVHLVEGFITDAGGVATREAREKGWFNISTMWEPYRLEGKKTMGYEIAEQFGWELPEVIVYPTGGGTGLIGMWKAFTEMSRLGWIGWARPRMIAVQAEGCSPIVEAFREGKVESKIWQDAETIASGLKVPKAIADFAILRVIRKSGGLAVAVRDDEILTAQREIAQREGIFACPEGAATLAALLKLKERDLVGPKERIVLFNTGSGLKYTHLLVNESSEIR